MAEEFASYVELWPSRSQGVANFEYWVEEFIATAEEYASKFDLESPADAKGSILCTLPEYAERRMLHSLLIFQFLARLYAPVHVVLNIDDWESVVGRDKLSCIMQNILISIA